MTMRVRLLLRPKPECSEWEAGEGFAREFHHLLTRSCAVTGTESPDLWNVPGYSGFEVTFSGLAAPDRRIWIPHKQRGNGRSGAAIAPAIRLLESGKAWLDPVLYQNLHRILTQEPPTQTGAGPDFDSGKLGNDPTTNCYGYALDNGGWRVPGNCRPHRWTESLLQEMILRDGLTAWEQGAALTQAGHFVAAFVSELSDFHFCRLDRDAVWSEKPGAASARRVSGNSAATADPRVKYVGTARFCGFFHVLKNHLQTSEK
jgi:hypothetical protein